MISETYIAGDGQTVFNFTFDTLSAAYLTVQIDDVTTSNWTLNQVGASQVPIAGIDDKRQITMVLANTPTGHVLPPQVVYAGLTDKCHPCFNFPPGWHITHTPNHWSNEETTLQYIQEVLIPYCQTQRAYHDLLPDHPALLADQGPTAKSAKIKLPRNFQ